MQDFYHFFFMQQVFVIRWWQERDTPMHAHQGDATALPENLRPEQIDHFMPAGRPAKLSPSQVYTTLEKLIAALELHTNNFTRTDTTAFHAAGHCVVGYAGSGGEKLWFIAKKVWLDTEDLQDLQDLEKSSDAP